jgi:hypothetical protein
MSIEFHLLSVISLCGIRLLTFLVELNQQEAWATDIGNAYLESYTNEKVYIVVGPEFRDRAGHTLVISKALYGLKSSGLRWSERFLDVLHEMKFFPSKMRRTYGCMRQMNYTNTLGCMLMT